MCTHHGQGLTQRIKGERKLKQAPFLVVEVQVENEVEHEQVNRIQKAEFHMKVYLSRKGNQNEAENDMTIGKW